jgi:hypothetical protein
MFRLYGHLQVYHVYKNDKIIIKTYPDTLEEGRIAETCSVICVQ